MDNGIEAEADTTTSPDPPLAENFVTAHNRMVHDAIKEWVEKYRRKTNDDSTLILRELIWTVDEEPSETVDNDVGSGMRIQESAGRIGILYCHVTTDKRPFPQTPESIQEADERSKRARLEAEHQLQHRSFSQLRTKWDVAPLSPPLSDSESSDSEDVIDDRNEASNHNEDSNDAASHADSGEGETEEHQDDQPNPESKIGVRNFMHARGLESRIDDLLNTIRQQMYQ